MIKQVEILLQFIYDNFGYDFLNYKREAIEKRTTLFLEQERIASIAELQKRIVADHEMFIRLIGKFTISVTSMFRDPEMFLFLREKVLPILATYPRIRIWSAGTGTGEEAYSLAIFLHEENLLHRAFIYATDINPVVLEKAYKGIYDLERISGYTTNYIAANGKKSFSKYYTTTARYAQIIPELRQNIIFSTHNLCQDTVFNEFQLIFCRNILIYFNTKLTNIVFKLLKQSLCARGFLCLGSAEDIKHYYAKPYFEKLHDKYKAFRKY